jgi:hypothetical protein
MYLLSHVSLTETDCLLLPTETTAHTLAATLGFLGLHQDIQEEILQHILDVVGPTREPASLLYHDVSTEKNANNTLRLDV